MIYWFVLVQYAENVFGVKEDSSVGGSTGQRPCVTVANWPNTTNLDCLQTCAGELQNLGFMRAIIVWWKSGI